jgi:hypothetical protein
MTEKEDDRELLVAALLWLRNHYELGGVPRKKVLKRIDRVLDKNPATIAGMKSFREAYPEKAPPCLPGK